jgi:hypothetical protein
MPMPKTSMHKYRGSIFGQNNVWVPRQVFPIKTETISHFVKQKANNCFGLRIFTAYSGHIPAAPVFCQMIGHLS